MARPRRDPELGMIIGNGAGRVQGLGTGNFLWRPSSGNEHWESMAEGFEVVGLARGGRPWQGKTSRINCTDYVLFQEIERDRP
jgi:hypothetical protein